MSEPGRRIDIKTVRKDVSRYVESDLARATTLTLTGSTAEVVDQSNARSILAVRWLNVPEPVSGTGGACPPLDRTGLSGSTT
jgi:hypothetical protein